MRVALVALFSLVSVAAHGQSDAQLKEMIATLLNLGGHLYARVTDVRPLRIPNQYEVTCVEYRGGAGQVRYIFDASTGKAFKAG